MSTPGFKSVGGVGRIFRAMRYSAQGFQAAFLHEAAFRQELLLGLFLVPAAFWLGRSLQETCLLLASYVLVLLVELVNSAIEAVVDRFGPERHELAGRAKDLGSAAVMLAFLLLALAWGPVAWARLLG
ncbi:MAG: diacylglycerol kinase [Burkholderiaceae bacterium]|nr:MAG: diacylglycerol kinase [Burkholderiaceae bacterium]